MVFVKKFEKDDILKLVAAAAMETLPNKQKGVVEAKYVKGGRGSIEVFFLPYETAIQVS